MRDILLALALTLTTTLPAAAQPAGPPCTPCLGVRVADPQAAAAALAQAPAIPEEARLYVAWDVDLGEAGASAAGAREVAEAGGTPWLRLVFRTPPPVTSNLNALEAELRRAAELARGAGPANHFQVLWQPEVEPGSDLPLDDFAFLFKRASVALAGARGDARVIAGPLAPAPAPLSRFYSQDTAAYLAGTAIEAVAGRELEVAVQILGELDPGRPVILDARPLPEPSSLALAQAAEAARQGVAVTFFTVETPTPELLAPLAVAAGEFAGDLSYDPYSLPEGAAGAWVFVRGSDLGLRVVARAPEEGGPLVVRFADPQLRRPARVFTASGEVQDLFGLTVLPDGAGIELRIADPEPVTLLRLDRATAAELEGVEERIQVEEQRTIPVEEILSRLQAVEDAQQRRLDHYQAVNTTNLRFQPSAGAATFEATLRGDFFFRQGEGWDWAWQEFLVNGVKWRGKKLPEIPLIQPEKAASVPLVIELSKRYEYRLVGSEEVDGRDCWVVEFHPVGKAEAEEENLYRGRVWIDRELYTRVRSRAVQLGLEGDVLSNEETIYFAPVDAAGEPMDWGAEGSFVLPLRTVAQQIFSVLNTATLVEREVLLTNIAINGADFDDRYRAVMASDATMVRDTDAGQRYLVKQEGSDERVVQEGFDTNRLFLAGGVFYDDALDYPLPLAGVNYFSLDVKGTGNQFNLFFGGALLTLDYAEPRLFGSHWDIGGDVFALAVPLADSLYRDGEEVVAEEVKSRPSNVSFLLGRPLGPFVKLELEYELSYDDFSSTDSTADEFVVPEDHFTHTFELGLRFDRFGYRLDLAGSYNDRSDWKPWGLPGNDEFDPAQKDYLLWETQVSKSWYLPKFQRFSAELGYFGGQDLDRFSKYQFGFFSGTRVHGFRSDRLRAEEVWRSQLKYGFLLGDLLRLEGVLDVALATDERSGLDNELLAGAGVVGQFIGPWNTIIQLDLGTPVEGPEDGFVAFVAFLKLFR